MEHVAIPEGIKDDWTIERIRELLERSDVAVYRGLQAIYARQTADEQESKATSHKNGVGFNGWDAPILSDIAQKSQRYGTLTPGQCALVRKKLKRYAGQLVKIANKEMN